MGKPLYIADRGTPAFAAGRMSVDVVCLGDSLTGWNNFGRPASWPWRTYPAFLAEMCAPLELKVANGGIAGEVSDNGPPQAIECLTLFPNARWFIFGMGTNDLTAWPDAEATSRRILANLARMVGAIREHGKEPILFNVPPVKESLLAPRRAAKVRARHEHHNLRLKEYCDEHRIPLSDIFALLHDDHFGDTLHPNDAGARIVAAEVYRALMSDCGKGMDHGGTEDTENESSEDSVLLRVLRASVVHLSSTKLTQTASA